MSTNQTATIAGSILLASIIVSASVAFSHRTREASSTAASVGYRYQFTAGTGKADEPFGDVFVLDAQTGRLWARVKENEALYWKEVTNVPWGGQPTTKTP